MTWGQLKQQIEEAIIDRTGGGFSLDDVEIDFINVQAYTSQIRVAMTDEDTHGKINIQVYGD
tara:strand:- start:7981 stop:8166 length:186 start_codon:yes stop_codon:yes gene_type:complete